MTSISRLFPTSSKVLASAVLVALMFGVSATAVSSGDAPEAAEASMDREDPSFEERFGNLPAQTRLGIAAKHGNLAAARRALEDGAIASRNFGNSPVLHQALQGGNPEIVELLLVNGANPDARYDYVGDEVGPLYLALRWYNDAGPQARDRYREIVRMLLDFGGRLHGEQHHYEESFKHPLNYAAQHCDMGLVKRLLQSGMDLTKSGAESIPLMLGCRNPEMVRLLLDHGAEITPAFVEWTLRGVNDPWKAEIAHWLLDEGVDSRGYRFVWAGMRWKDYKLLERALSGGASPDRYVQEERSTNNVPLITAAIHGRIEPTRILLKHGASTQSTWRGKNPAEWARKEGYEEIAQLIEQFDSGKE